MVNIVRTSVGTVTRTEVVINRLENVPRLMGNDARLDTQAPIVQPVSITEKRSTSKKDLR